MINWIIKSTSVLVALFIVSCTSIDLRLSLKEVQVTPLEGQKVLIVNANAQVERYRVAEEAFVALFKQEKVESLDLAKDIEPLELLLDQLNANDYDAIYCIGAKSLGLIDHIAPDVPVVYSSVIDWRKFQNSPGFYGVASEISLAAQLTWFKHFFPGLESVGVIYSEKNAALISEAKELADSLNINLIAKEATVSGGTQELAENLMANVQAFWLISDLAVLSSGDRVDKLFKLAKSKQVSVLSYSDLFVDMGALLSISADLPTVGRQAALIMKSLLRKDFSGDNITYPAGSHLILNAKRLESSTLKLNEYALDSVSEIRD